MMNCGYEPTAALGLNGKRGDLLKTIKFNFGTKPKPKPVQVDAFNGVTSGKGHLTGADAPAQVAKNSCSSTAGAEKESLAATAAK
jgi:hypothetical protein